MSLKISKFLTVAAFAAALGIGSLGISSNAFAFDDHGHGHGFDMHGGGHGFGHDWHVDDWHGHNWHGHGHGSCWVFGAHGPYNVCD